LGSYNEFKGVIRKGLPGYTNYCLGSIFGPEDLGLLNYYLVGKNWVGLNFGLRIVFKNRIFGFQKKGFLGTYILLEIPHLGWGILKFFKMFPEKLGL